MSDQYVAAPQSTRTDIPDVSAAPDFPESTRPTLDWSRCRFARAWVETPVDTDGDGLADLVAVYLRLPEGADAAHPVPALYVADPYMLGCDDDGYRPHATVGRLKAFPPSETTWADVSEGEGPCAIDPDHRPTRRRPACAGEPVPAPSCAPRELECISEYYSYYNCCGYATVFCAGLGTLDSEGYNDCGSPEETAAFRAVIDWLCGRARAYADPAGSQLVEADWCTGKVAMTGKSYLGTMCVAVASTGVEGLEAIIPVAGISNWYEYYRCNGLARPALGWQGDDIDLLASYCFSRRNTPGLDEVVLRGYQAHLIGIGAAQNRDEGGYTAWWNRRDYLRHMTDHPCPALIVQGLNDWNVKPSQAMRMARAWHERGAVCSMLLHQGDHIYAHDLEGSPAHELMHRWLDHWLLGVDNGVPDDVPAVITQSNLDQRVWMASDGMPGVTATACRVDDADIDAVFADATTLALSADEVAAPSAGEAAPFPGGRVSALSLPQDASELPLGTIIDDTCGLADTDGIADTLLLGQWRDRMALGRGARPHDALRLTGEPLVADMRLRGELLVEFDAGFSTPTAAIGVMLVELGERCRLTAHIEDAPGEPVQWGEHTPSTQLKRFRVEESPSRYRILTRGWTNAQNVHGAFRKERLLPGRRYHYRLTTEPIDTIVPAGSRLRLVVFGADPEATVTPAEPIAFAVDPATVAARIHIASADAR